MKTLLDQTEESAISRILLSPKSRDLSQYRNEEFSTPPAFLCKTISMVTNRHSWPLGSTPNKSLACVEPSIPSPQWSRPLDSCWTIVPVQQSFVPQPEAIASLRSTRSVLAVVSFPTVAPSSFPLRPSVRNIRRPVPDMGRAVHDRSRAVRAPRFAKRTSLLGKHFGGVPNRAAVRQYCCSDFGKPNSRSGLPFPRSSTLFHAIFHPPPPQCLARQPLESGLFNVLQVPAFPRRHRCLSATREPSSIGYSQKAEWQALRF